MKTPRTPEELIKLARSLPGDERVPYAFEKRVMARLGSAAPADAFTMWAQALWRGVAPSLGIMALALAISFAHSRQSTMDSEVADLETAVYAPIQLALGDSW